MQPFDRTKINTAISQGEAILATDIDSASRLFHQAWAWSKQIQYHKGIAVSILNSAESEQLKGNYVRALHILEQAASYCLPRGNTNASYTLRYYQNLLEDYAGLGRTDSAIHYAYKALNRLKTYDRDSTYETYIWYFNARLGALFNVDGYHDFNKSLYYLYLSEEYAVKSQNKKRLIYTYLSLGAAYANQVKREIVPKMEGYEKGIYYYKMAASLSRDTKNEITLGDAYSNLGIIYINQNKTDSGEYFIKKAMEIPAYTQYPLAVISAYGALGAEFLNSRQYKKAEQYLLIARDQSQALHANAKLMELEKLLSLLYEATNENKKALIHLQAYNQLREIIVDKDKINTVTQLDVKYQTAEKNQELALNKLKLSQQSIQIYKKNIWIAASILAVLLLVALLLSVQRHSRHKQQRQEERLRLMEQQQLLWAQGEEIRNLNAMVKGEEKERARLGRELHDGIVGQLTAAQMNFNSIQRKYNVPGLMDELKGALMHLKDTTLELRKTAHNLLPEILLQHGLVTATDSFCEKTSAFTGIQFDFHIDGFVPRLDTDLELSVYRMIQELVQNIIKHANATKTLVQLDYREPLLLITVEDNGIGIENQATPTGMGLPNLATRVKALQGNLHITGSPGEGTSVYIELDILQIKQSAKT